MINILKYAELYHGGKTMNGSFTVGCAHIFHSEANE
jgi:hypothetical protein